MSVITVKPAAEPVYHNPDPLVRHTGHSNEATIVIERVMTTALVDTGSQVSTK